MPRGKESRFEDVDEPEDDEATSAEQPSQPEDSTQSGRQVGADGDTNTSSHEEPDAGQAESAGTQDQYDSEGPARHQRSGSSVSIKEDWDHATVYIPPSLNTEMNIEFTRLKEELKRDGIAPQKNKHFYRAIFQVAFEEHQDEVKQRVRELAEQE